MPWTDIGKSKLTHRPTVFYFCCEKDTCAKTNIFQSKINNHECKKLFIAVYFNDNL